MEDPTVQKYIDRALSQAEQRSESGASHTAPVEVGGVDLSTKGRAATTLARKIFNEMLDEEPESVTEESWDLPNPVPATPAAPEIEETPAPSNVIEFPSEATMERDLENPRYITDADLRERANQAFVPLQMPKSANALGSIPRLAAPAKGPSLAQQRNSIAPAPFKPIPPPKMPKPKALKVPKAPDAGTLDSTNKYGEFEALLDGYKAALELPRAPLSMGTRKEQDLALWRAWKAAPSKQTLEPLMRAMTPVLKSEVSRWGSQVPRAALDMESRKLALEAFKSYDPNAGTALATHVLNRTKKLSRMVYNNQDLVRLPENRKLKSQTYHNGFNYLAGEFGRDPTNVELADHLGWSPANVSSVQRSTVGEYLESQDVGGEMFSDVHGTDDEDFRLDFVYHSLDPTDQLIFEHSTGYSGKRVLSTKDLAAKVGLTVNQVTHRKRKLTQKIKQFG